VLFLFVLGGDFRSPLLVDFLVRFRDLALEDLVGDGCVNLSWIISLCFLSQVHELRGSTLGFSVL
jgi:hypothetical protein